MSQQRKLSNTVISFGRPRIMFSPMATERKYMTKIVDNTFDFNTFLGIKEKAFEELLDNEDVIDTNPASIGFSSFRGYDVYRVCT